MDLHLHSNCSNDGDFAPGELAALAAKTQLKLLSLTDHNSVAGVSDLAGLLQQTGIQFLPGIELDCRYAETDLHVLGYQINWKSADFESLHSDIHKKEREAFPQMVELLNACGFDVRAADVMTFAGGRLPCGELVGEYLLNHESYSGHPLLAVYRTGGSRSDNPYLNFYRDFFAQGRPAYVPIEYMPYSQAIDLIRCNGGIPVIAHPGANLAGREFLVEELVKLGAEGVEVFNNYNSPAQISYFCETGVRKKWLLTCGSDFHGRNKPAISMGRFVSDDRFAWYVAEEIRKRLLEK